MWPVNETADRQFLMWRVSLPSTNVQLPSAANNIRRVSVAIFGTRFSWISNLEDKLATAFKGFLVWPDWPVNQVILLFVFWDRKLRASVIGMKLLSLCGISTVRCFIQNLLKHSWLSVLSGLNSAIPSVYFFGMFWVHAMRFLKQRNHIDFNMYLSCLNCRRGLYHTGTI